MMVRNGVLSKLLSRPITITGTPSISSAFLLPQWGGIVIHNPVTGTSAATELPSPELHEAFSLFANQLLALLGVPALPAGVVDMAQVGEPSDWQLDALVRRRTFENAQESQDTLLSIVKLVDQIENMPVGEDVRGDVDEALEALNKVNILTEHSHHTWTYRKPNRCMNCQGNLSTKPLPTLPSRSVFPLVLSLILGCWLCFTFLLSTSTPFIALYLPVPSSCCSLLC